MSRHARIEEVSDSESDADPVDMDPSDFDPARFGNSIIQPASSASTSANPTLMNPTNIPFNAGASSDNNPTITSAEDIKRFAHYQCLYPLYFDKTRSKAEGRRVNKELAVENPLAPDIVDAVQGLALTPVFEPGKLHPKDWSNPGRIRVLVKVDGEPVNRKIQNKHHLYTLVADYLRKHPTSEASVRRMRYAGMPPPDPTKPLPKPAVPRGWKIGSMLPLYSPALSGGGVGEDFLKEMMAEMQGRGQIDADPTADAGAVTRKKEKKAKKKGKA
ncbi:MAG: hypothetical protein M1825_005759 [Sarcosagium campestre]|nr:MAG: hypothetical protein M1825_005759 [Sarcosagium campestre]